MPSASRPSPNRSLAILALAGLAFSLAQTMIVPALGDMKARLDTDETGIAWTLTGYLLAAAVATPVFGRLGDMFGKRRMLVTSIGFFVAGSVVSALGSSLELVVAGRVLQGVGGGIFPLCFGIIRDEFPADRVATSIGLISAILGIGGGVGLILGGILVDAVGYHILFWLGGAMALIAGVAAQLFVPESTERTSGRVDLVGAAVLAVGLVLPLYAIANANEWGWASGRTLGLIGGGLAVLAGWVLLELRTREPLVDIRLLATPSVAMTNVATLFVGFGMFGSFLLIPQLLEAPEATGFGFGYTATSVGLIMLPGSLAMLVVGPLSGRLSARVNLKLPLALGGALTGAGLLGLALVHTTAFAVLAWAFLLSVGIGFAFAAMPNLIVAAVPRHQTGEATGFNQLVRSVGSSLGSQVSAAILAGSAGLAGPTDAGFTAAFAASAGVALFAGVTAVLIPRLRAEKGDDIAAPEEAEAVPA